MIYLIFGSQGGGKTLYLTRCAYNGYKQGKKVYSNFKLNFPHKILEFKEMMDCKYNNAIIIIDEAHLWGLDARESHTKKNRGLVKQFITQVRKQGVDLICSTQRPRQIDVRVRENAEFIAYCKKYAYDNKKIIPVTQSKKFNKNVPIIIELMVTDLDQEKTKYLRFHANKYYDLYDTREVIKMI